MNEARVLPRGLLAWFPYIWSKVLFTGSMRESTAIRLSSLLLVLILPAILLYPTRSFHLLEPDEGRYAQIPREMLDRGEWVVPHLQSQPYLDKPPLFYWLVMLAYSLFGVSDSVARLIPALATHATILVVYLLGRRSLGERSAFWGALLLTICPGFLGMSRLLILDGLLTFWIILSLLTMFEAIRGEQWDRRWWYLSALACGFGVLTKGPISILLLFPPMLAYRWLSGNRVAIPVRAVVSFFAVVFLINLPWYVAIYMREPIFLKYFFWDHNILRFVQPFDHLEPVWYYVPIVLGGLFPVLFLLWKFLRFLITEDSTFANQRTLAMSFWLLAGLWCIGFFSVSGSKLPTYVLPAFPTLLLALGAFVAQTRWRTSTWTRSSVGVTFGVLAFGFYVALPWYAEKRSPMWQPEVVSRFCADPETPVVCFPRNCDSVAFYLNRDDLRNVRSKLSQTLIEWMMERPRTVVLLTHRHSLEALKTVMPPQLRITESVSFRRKTDSLLDKCVGDTPWGLCDVAVVERVH